MVELCDARKSILTMDESTILEEAKNINLDKIMSTIKRHGAYFGITYILLLNLSAHLTKQIGMAPGGEFRVAYKEVRDFVVEFLRLHITFIFVGVQNTEL